jgi:hypothetical protein
MPYGNLNVDTVTTSTTGGILGAGNASIMKNRIINGAMVIDQRNAGASVTLDTTNFGYTADRWGAIESTDGVMTAQQVTTAPTGFNNSLKLTTTTADSSLGATQFAYVGQRIEGYNVADLGWGTANAKTVTVSFWVRSSLTGTFGGSIYNDGANRSYPFSYTISVADTWEQKSVTIAGDTSGTWLTTNGVGLILVFALGVGSTYSNTAGAWVGALAFSSTSAVSVVGTLNATFYITGVQLEVGSSATGFEYVNYQTSLANCQRYFETNSVYLVANTTAYTPFLVPYVVKRAAPSVVATGMPGTVSSQNLGLNCYSGFFNLATLGSAVVTFTISAEL